MNVLYINTIEYNINGIANVIFGYIETLHDLNSDLNFFVTSIGYFDKKYQRIASKTNTKVLSLPSRKRFLSYFKTLINVIKKNKIDLVHINGNSSTMILESICCKIAHVKFICHAHNTSCSHLTIHKILRPYLNFISKNNLACSTNAGKFAFKKKFHVLFNGIDVDKFKFDYFERNTFRNDYDVKDDEILLLHVGVFNHQKNQEFLIKVLADIKIPYKMIFVGVGENLEKCKSMVQDLNLTDKIIFAGEQHNLKKFYSGADLFLFPSIFEGFGIVLIEAQVNGLRCMCSTEISEEVNLDNHIDFFTLIPIVWRNYIGNSQIRSSDDNFGQIPENFYSKFSHLEISKKLLKYYLSILECKK